MYYVNITKASANYDLVIGLELDAALRRLHFNAARDQFARVGAAAWGELPVEGLVAPRELLERGCVRGVIANARPNTVQTSPLLLRASSGATREERGRTVKALATPVTEEPRREDDLCGGGNAAPVGGE
jgi:hypothetical protein